MLKQHVLQRNLCMGTPRGVVLRRVAVAAAAAAVVAAAWAVPAGTEFTYQGRLKKSGNLVTGLTDFRFSLWDDPVAGNQIGSTLEFSNDPAAVGPPVQVTRGLFKVELDFGLGAFDGSERWLQIEVRHPAGDPSGFALLSQRQKVTATPYAIVAIGQSRLAASDGDPADALVVDAAGNVGIGTASPQARLDVAGSVIANGPITAAGDITGTRLLASQNIFGGSVELSDVVPFVDFHSNNDPGDFTARIVQFAPGELLRVQGPGLAVDGNLGIGTVSPAAKLDVEGGVVVNGPLTAAGDITGTRLSVNSSINGDNIELSGLTPFVDFHAAQDPSDFTARIIQSAPVELLRVQGPGLAIDGRLGVGTTTPGWKLDVAGDVHSHAVSVIGPPIQPPFEPRIEVRPDSIWWFAGGQSASFVLISTNDTLRLENANLRVNGNISASGDISASGNCCSSSDLRFKKNVRPLRGALELTDQLSPVRFRWRTDAFPDRNFRDDPQIGFIAQEMLEVLPELVTQDEDGYYAMDYGRLTAVLTAAVQELHQMLKTQAGRIGQAEERIETLEAANSELKAANKALRQRLDDQQAQLDELKRQLADLRAMVRMRADVPAGHADAGRPR